MSIFSIHSFKAFSEFLLNSKKYCINAIYSKMVTFKVGIIFLLMEYILFLLTYYLSRSPVFNYDKAIKKKTKKNRPR